MESSTVTAARNDGPVPGIEAVRLREAIRERALLLGFATCGFTGAGDLDCGSLLEGWVASGRHGLMDYLDRDLHNRVSPRQHLPAASSVIVVAWPYRGAWVPPDPDWRQQLTGRVAAYALGDDYHRHVGEKLERLASFLRERGGRSTTTHVDAGPLAERHLAVRAGLGWYGHNTLLLHRQLGSTILLGCLLTDLQIPPDPPLTTGHCGTCRACVSACPTGALDSGPTIDARLCISYLTIELRGPLPLDLRSRVGNWVFGCDTCQDVCPWNDPAQQPDPRLTPSLSWLLEMSEEEFRGAWARTAVVRAKRRGLARNAAVALGNSGNAAAAEPLARALAEHDEPLVRAHAAWALGEIGGSDSEHGLQRAERSDRVPPVRRAAGEALAKIRKCQLTPRHSDATLPQAP